MAKNVLKAWLVDNAVTTQYKGSSSDLLKSPRGTSQTIYIDTAPSSGSSSGSMAAMTATKKKNLLGLSDCKVRT